MRIGIAEFLVIIVVALAFLKPDKLSEYAKTLGQALRTFSDETKNMNESIIEPVKENLVEPIKEVIEPVTSLQNEINQSFSDISSTMKGEK